MNRNACSICYLTGHNKRTCLKLLPQPINVSGLGSVINKVNQKKEKQKKEKQNQEPKLILKQFKPDKVKEPEITQNKHENYLNVKDINTFFVTSTRSGNDEANKIREKILFECFSTPPIEFMNDKTYGHKWSLVYHKWNDVIKHISVNIDSYTHTTIKSFGGRMYNFDALLSFYQGETCISSVKIEFKYGGTRVVQLPQFLSLQTKFPLFSYTYEDFYYDHYMDQYIACDPLIKDKPSKLEYKKIVSSTSFNHPFFIQLKERKAVNVFEKNQIVNRSIKDYLDQYGETIDINCFYKKALSQQDKLFILWSNDKFHIDSMIIKKMSFHGIKNGNTIQLESESIMYSLLLRWRNHKGILNPAWQISLKSI